LPAANAKQAESDNRPIRLQHEPQELRIPLEVGVASPPAVKSLFYFFIFICPNRARAEREFFWLLYGTPSPPNSKANSGQQSAILDYRTPVLMVSEGSEESKFRQVPVVFRDSLATRTIELRINQNYSKYLTPQIVPEHRDHEFV